ncbi:uncharacterized protein LY89DRAFT_591271, partial [Mollisia scopiformis]
SLSHCWGSKDELVTKKENLWKMCDGLPVSALPHTFRDAVIITRRLGYRYLCKIAFAFIMVDPE